MALSTEKAKSSKNSLIQDSHPRPHEQNPHTDPTDFTGFARLTWNLTEDYGCSWEPIQSDFYTYFIHFNPIYTDFKKVNKFTSQQVNEQ